MTKNPPIHKASLTHAIYFAGLRAGERISYVTHARRGRKGTGKRIAEASIEGENLVIAYDSLRTIIKRQSDHNLPTNLADVESEQYIPLTQPTATQIRLAMQAVQQSKSRREARRLAAAVADMHECESNWWMACLLNRHRPRKVLSALTLMYA